MKHGDAPRKVLYLLLGIVPSLSLLPLPLIFMRAPIGTLFFISLAAIGGCIGLCLAVFYQPSRANSQISLLIALLLLAAGSVVAGTMFFGFFLSLVREPLTANTSLMLLLLGSPLVVAAHYIKSLASGLWSKHGVA